MRSSRLVLSLVIAAVLTQAASASAQPEADAQPFAVVLEYAAPPNCPEVGEFEATVSKRLGYVPFVQSKAPRVLVLVSREEKLEGRIVWRDAAGKWNGEQTFPSRSNDCSELVVAMGFALAIQIQLLTPNARSESAAPPAVPDPSAEPSPPEPKPAASPHPSAPSEQSVPPRITLPYASGPNATFGLGAGAGLGVGFAPKADVSTRVFGSVSFAHVSFELAGEADLPTSGTRADGAGFSERYVLGSFAACGTDDHFGACGVLRTGALRVNGRDIDRPASSSALLLQTGLRLAVSHALSPHVFVAARLEGLVNLTRWTVNLDQVPVWSAPRLGGLGGLDFGLLLW